MRPVRTLDAYRLPFGAVASPEKVSIPSEGTAKVSRCTASATGAPVGSTPPQPPAASGPVGNGGENRSMLSPEVSAT